MRLIWLLWVLWVGIGIGYCQGVQRLEAVWTGPMVNLGEVAKFPLSIVIGESTLWTVHTSTNLTLLTNDQRVLGNITITKLSYEYSQDNSNTYDQIVFAGKDKLLLTDQAESYFMTTIQTRVDSQGLVSYAFVDGKATVCIKYGLVDCLPTEIFLITSSIYLPGTTYVLLFKSATNYIDTVIPTPTIADLRHVRFDISTRSHTAFQSTFNPREYTYIFSPEMLTDDLVIARSSYSRDTEIQNRGIMVMRCDNGVAVVYNIFTEQSESAKFGVLDNLGRKRYYVFYESKFLASLSIDPLPAGGLKLPVQSSLNLQGSIISFHNSLSNLGPFQYLVSLSIIEGLGDDLYIHFVNKILFNVETMLQRSFSNDRFRSSCPVVVAGKYAR